jgi:hypothetical protein
MRTARIGFGDLTAANNAAIALVNAYGSSGVPSSSDPLVSAYQSGWNSTGPTADTVLTVDGLYGPLTASALAATLAVYNGVNGTAYVAPQANSYSSGGGSATPTAQQQQDMTTTAQSATASIVGSIPGGWWTVAAVAAVGVALIYEGTSHHKMMGAPHKAGKAIHHHARRVMKRRGKPRRRR